jgi:hypothetical protein
MPVLYCEPVNGLANRFMFLASAIRLAHRNGYDVTIVWKPDNALNCKITDLICVEHSVVDESPGLVPEASISEARYVIDFSRIKGKDVYVKGFHFIFELSDFALDKVIISNQIRLHFQRLVPVPAVADALGNDIYDLGLHVRRSTIIDTQDWGRPSDEFIACVCSYAIGKMNSRAVFIAASSVQSKEFMKRNLKIPDVSISTSSVNAWTLSSDSAVSDFVEMLKLARCRVIVRPAISTFSALPALINSVREFIYSEDEVFADRTPYVLTGNAL